MQFNVSLQANNGEAYYWPLSVEIKPTSRAVKSWITRNMEKAQRAAFFHLSPAAQKSGVKFQLHRVDNGVFIASTNI